MVEPLELKPIKYITPYDDQLDINKFYNYMHMVDFIYSYLNICAIYIIAIA